MFHQIEKMIGPLILIVVMAAGYFGMFIGWVVWLGESPITFVNVSVLAAAVSTALIGWMYMVSLTIATHREWPDVSLYDAFCITRRNLGMTIEEHLIPRCEGQNWFDQLYEVMDLYSNPLSYRERCEASTARS